MLEEKALFFISNFKKAKQEVVILEINPIPLQVKAEVSLSRKNSTRSKREPKQ
jgi:hypothetical protein